MAIIVHVSDVTDEAPPQETLPDGHDRVSRHLDEKLGLAQGSHGPSNDTQDRERTDGDAQGSERERMRK